jgi:hypothetical protein
MALLLKNKAVFLHVPKTGGSWVTSILERQGLIERRFAQGHADMDRAMRWFGRPWWRNRRPTFIFCFVRNPLTWYESWFRYMSHPERNWMHFGQGGNDVHPIQRAWPHSLLNDCAAQDFNEFVERAVRLHPGYVSELFSWYTKPPISFIGKQERLTEDLIRALRQSKLAFDEDAIRAASPVNSGDRTIKALWDPALRNKVIQLEGEAFDRYDYDPSSQMSRPLGATQPR